jgi:hypothetical protein
METKTYTAEQARLWDLAVAAVRNAELPEPEELKEMVNAKLRDIMAGKPATFDAYTRWMLGDREEEFGIADHAVPEDIAEAFGIRLYHELIS